jgi:hypothetical protein
MKHRERKGFKGGFVYHQMQLVDFLLFCKCIQYSVINMFQNELSLNALLIEENFCILIRYFLFMFSYWQVLLA